MQPAPAKPWFVVTRLVGSVQLRLVAVGYLAVLMVLTHSPRIPPPPVPRGLIEPDKIIHFGAYALLALLIAAARPLPRASGPAQLLFAVIATAAIGVLDELTQPWFGRNGNVYDMLADALGGLAMVIFLWPMVVDGQAGRRMRAAEDVGNEAEQRPAPSLPSPTGRGAGGEGRSGPTLRVSPQPGPLPKGEGVRGAGFSGQVQRGAAGVDKPGSHRALAWAVLAPAATVGIVFPGEIGQYLGPAGPQVVHGVGAAGLALLLLLPRLQIGAVNEAFRRAGAGALLLGLAPLAELRLRWWDVDGAEAPGMVGHMAGLALALVVVLIRDWTRYRRRTDTEPRITDRPLPGTDDER